MSHGSSARGLEADRHLGRHRLDRLLTLDADHPAARTGHADVGDVGGAARQHARIGRRHVGVRADDRGHAPVEVPAHPDLLARRLGVHVDEDVVGLSREGVQGGIGLGERRPPRVHEQVARQRHDPQPRPRRARRRTSRGPGWLRRKFAGRRISSSLVEVGVDLALAVGVVAERDHVDAGGEQLIGDLRGDSEAAGHVLAVDDDEVRAPGARAGAGSNPSSVRLPRPPTRSPTNRILTATCAWAVSLILSGVCVHRSDCAGRPGEHPRVSLRRSAMRAGGPPEDAAAPDQDAAPAPEAPEGAPSWADAGPLLGRRRSSCPAGCRLVVLPLSLLALWALARAAGTVLLVLIVASIVALILAPTVRLLERTMPRGLAISLVYLAGFAVIARDRFPAGQSGHRPDHALRAQRAAQIVANANHELDNIQSWLTVTGSTSTSSSRARRRSRHAAEGRASSAAGTSSRSPATCSPAW